MRLIWAKWLARLPGCALPRSFHRRNHSVAAGLHIPIIFILLFLALLPSRSTCQDFASLRGIVTDSLLNEPIAGVVVTVLPDGKSVQTSTSGQFHFTGLTPGQVTLHVESAFHASQTIGPLLIREGDLRDVNLQLYPLTVSGEPVEVTADRESGIGVTSLPLTSSRKAGATNVGDFLNRNGFHLESDGRTKYASLRGFSPQCVLVLIDGVPINPDGAPADLSTISTESVERVDVYTTGASSRFGANALGGAVNIISKTAPSQERFANLAAAHGSFDLQRGAANLSMADMLGVGANAGYDYLQQSNDFDYEHPYNGEQTRINNSSRVYSGYVSLRPESISGFSMQARISNSHNELPGAIFQETGGGAMAKRENRYYSLGYEISRFQLDATFRELRQKFADHSGFIAYDKEYLQTARMLHANFESAFLRHFVVSAGSELSSESFFNDDKIAPQRSLPAVSRKTIAAFGGLSATRNIGKLELSAESRYRLDHIDDKTHGSPFAGAAFKFHLPVTVGAQASYSESFRLPPIDALFWRGDVFTEANPQLRPEQAISREAGLSLKYARSFTFELTRTWFKSDMEDLIIWRRQFDGRYKPVNINQSRHVGAETAITLAPKNRRFELMYFHTSLEATNLSHSSGYYGQIVPFKPDQIERLSLQFDAGLFTTRYSYSFTGERQIREANTKSLPGFALHDVEIEVPISLWSRKHTLQLAMFNITDVRYELLERMPMPPRSASLTINIQI